MRLKLIVIDLELTRRAKATLVLSAIAIAVGATAGGFAQDESLIVWNSGDTLHAKDLNANFGHLGRRLDSLVAMTKNASASAGPTPLSKAVFRVIKEGCTEYSDAVDCSCARDEVALIGGGFCNNLPLNESANIGSDRLGTTWRVRCVGGTPSGYYAICVKLTP